MIATTSVMVFYMKDAIVYAFTTDEEVRATAIKVIWVISLSNFPDGYKGMLKGVIRALGLQSRAVYINIAGHWCINLTL